MCLVDILMLEFVHCAENSLKIRFPAQNGLHARFSRIILLLVHAKTSSQSTRVSSKFGRS